jgi:hypothetical protein
MVNQFRKSSGKKEFEPMNKKFFFSLILACVLTTAVVFQVIAGAVFDYGTLAGKAEGDPPPPEGTVNWVAWWDEDNGIPYEILTEDKPIYMVFGGLGKDWSGTIWKYTIPRWVITQSITDHGIVPIHTTEGAACPTIQEQPVYGEERTVMFWGEPGYYHVYRSQNGSGHSSNNASNGRYFYLFSTTTDESGVGVFTDSESWDLENWYLVIQYDPETKEIIGCHSEPTKPTSVRIPEFSSEFDFDNKEIRLFWETTANDYDILGFNLSRSGSDGISIKLTDLLPMLPGQTEYTFTDTNIQLGETYHYTLKVLLSNMRDEDIDTISQRAGYVLFMPLIQ